MAVEVAGEDPVEGAVREREVEPVALHRNLGRRRLLACHDEHPRALVEADDVAGEWRVRNPVPQATSSVRSGGSAATVSSSSRHRHHSAARTSSKRPRPRYHSSYSGPRASSTPTVPRVRARSPLSRCELLRGARPRDDEGTAGAPPAARRGARRARGPGSQPVGVREALVGEDDGLVEALVAARAGADRPPTRGAHPRSARPTSSRSCRPPGGSGAGAGLLDDLRARRRGTGTARLPVRRPRRARAGVPPPRRAGGAAAADRRGRAAEARTSGPRVSHGGGWRDRRRAPSAIARTSHCRDRDVEVARAIALPRASATAGSPASARWGIALPRAGRCTSMNVEDYEASALRLVRAR